MAKFYPAFACLLIASGCTKSATVRDTMFYPQAFANLERMLVVPMENLTPFPEAGLIVSDLIADELRAWQGYDIRDRHNIEQIARGGAEPLPLHWNRAEAIKFAKLLDAKAALFGTITEFGYLREHRGLTELATFAVVLKIVNVESGRVLWSGTLLGTGGSNLTTGRPPLMDVSSNTVQAALRNLFGAYEKFKAGQR